MLQVFEIHITGDKKIIEAAKSLNVNTIVIDLVKPDRSYFRTEYMTSHTYRCKDYDECKQWVDGIVSKLKDAGVNIIRVKIECPRYPQYADQSLYFEIHFQAKDNCRLPMSRNHGKDYFLCTDREYDKKSYGALAIKYCCMWRAPPHFTTEYCLYDTNVEEDKDWFDLYEGLNDEF